MKAKIAKNSGAGGKLSGLLYGRFDLAKQQTADKEIENFVPLAEGARTRLPGTRFVAPYKDETRPLRFIQFDAGGGDTAMLAFNGGVMRIYADAPGMDGASPYELAHPFADDQLETLFAAQSLNTLFIASGGKPKRLVRNGPTSWVIEDYPYVQGPLRLQNLDKTTTLQASGETGTVTLTASKPVFLAGHVGSVWRLDENDYATPPEWKAIESPIALGARRRYKGRIYEVVALNVTAPAVGDTGPNPPVHDDGDFFSSGGNVTWRFISKSYGYVKITGVTSPTSATAVVLDRLPTALVSTPSYRWYEAAWSDVRGWPTAVSIVDQSVVWLMGNRGYITSPLDIYSFEITTEDDSAVEFALFGPDGKLVEAEWTIPAGVIVVGGSSHEFIIRGASNIYDRLTNTNQRAIPQGTYGSVRHTPAFVEGGAVFIARSREKLVFAAFDAALEKVELKDFTEYSREMLSAGAMQLAFQADPYNIIFVRLADGGLVSVTFKPSQEVLGWAEHPKENGKVLQIGTRQSSDSRRTELWEGVERVINGTTRRYIEVMQPYFQPQDRKNPTAAGAWFLDCAVRYDGPATATITGLAHLEGQTVGVFCNGQQFANRVVTGGSITIERPMTGVVVGLPIKARIRSLPFDTQTQAGTSIGSLKSAAHVLLHLHHTAGGAIGNIETEATGLYESGGLPFSTPLPLLSEMREYTIDPRTALELELELTCDDALPCTLLSWIPEIEIKD